MAGSHKASRGGPHILVTDTCHQDHGPGVTPLQGTQSSVIVESSQESERDRVLKRLRETGYPLELRVAAAMRNADAYYVNQSRHYVDPITSKIRETDVIGCWRAVRGDKYVFTYLVVECKSKPRPWVVFDANEGLTHDVEILLGSLSTLELYEEPQLLTRVKDPFFPVQGTFLEPVQFGHAVVDSKVGKTDTVDNRDDAYNAVMAAMSAVGGFLNDVDGDELAAAARVAAVVLPVVVTGGSLYRGWLDDTGDVDIEAVDLAWVALRNDEEPRVRRCAIVREAALPDLLQRAKKTANVLLGRAQP